MLLIPIGHNDGFNIPLTFRYGVEIHPPELGVTVICIVASLLHIGPNEVMFGDAGLRTDTFIVRLSGQRVALGEELVLYVKV